jgi:hypothetical protein
MPSNGWECSDDRKCEGQSTGGGRRGDRQYGRGDGQTAIQIADIVAYLAAWGVRVGGMSRPAREELADLAMQVCDMRYQARREVNGNPDFAIWSFALIDDLRPREKREENGGQ